MKKFAILSVLAISLTGCASHKRFAYIANDLADDVRIEETEKETTVWYSKKYYDSAIKITPSNAADKLRNAKLPTPVLISGTVIDSVRYKDRADIGRLKGVNWLGADKYKGSYLFNDVNSLIVKFPVGSTDYYHGYNYTANPTVSDLFCVANVVSDDDIKLMMQDLVWFGTLGKRKINIIPSAKTNKNGTKLYIDFTDCAFVRPQHQK